jgi:putative hydrolase of the HAD superfamily
MARNYGDSLLGIQNFFDVILISEEQGIKKPDPEIFWRAVDKLGITPEESIFVGDHPLNDVQASQSIGMKDIWKRDRFWKYAATSDVIIDDLSEIISWFELKK